MEKSRELWKLLPANIPDFNDILQSGTVKLKSGYNLLVEYTVSETAHCENVTGIGIFNPGRSKRA